LLDPSLTERVLERLRDGPKVDPRIASLTPQERRILDLIAEGYTNRQIAETMFLAEKTVKNYVSNLLAKLGMERRTQAATFAARLNERSARSLGPTPPAPEGVRDQVRPGSGSSVSVAITKLNRARPAPLDSLALQLGLLEVVRIGVDATTLARSSRATS